MKSRLVYLTTFQCRHHRLVFPHSNAVIIVLPYSHLLDINACFPMHAAGMTSL